MEQKLKLEHELYDGAANSSKIAKSNYRYGSMLVQAGRHAEAEHYLEKGAVVYSLVHGEYDSRTHEVHAALGRV